MAVNPDTNNQSDGTGGAGGKGSAGANGASGPSVRLNAAQGDGATPEIVAKIQPRATSGH